MKPTLPKQNTETNFESTEFGMKLGREQLSKISRLLITGQYTDPLTASVREILSNAYDANIVASYKDKQERAVDITMSKDRISIRDYGEGLSEEDMFELYTLIGQSTKEGDNNQIGAFGVGRLAPLALNDVFFITSYNGGYKTLYCCHLNEDHIPSLAVWDKEEYKEADTGLQVDIMLPSSVTNARSDIREKLCWLAVQYVSEGSRHKINYINNKLDNIPRYHLEDFYYFTVQDNELDFSVDYYMTNRTQRTFNEFFVDLGGAIYMATSKGFEPYPIVNSNHVQYINFDHCHWTLPLEENLTRHFKDIYESKSLEKASYHSGNGYTVIVRLKPDSFVLNTSRESIVNTEEQTERLKDIYNRARLLIEEELSRRATKIAAGYTKQRNIQDQSLTEALSVCLRHATELLSCAPHPLTGSLKESSFRYSYDLPDEYTLEIHARDIQDVISVEDKVIRISPYNRENKINNGFYMLRSTDDEDDLHTSTASYIKSNYADGVYKLNPYKVTELNIPLVIRHGFSILYSNDRNLTIKRVKDKFGQDVFKRPVVVILQPSEVNQKWKDYSPAINCLGYYDRNIHEDVTKKRTTTSNKKVKQPTDRELSVLMRQLRYTTDYLINGGSGRITPRTLTSDEAAALTPEILKEKVIYAVSSKDREIQIDEYYVSCLPKWFLREYSPIRVTLSESAAEKIQRLTTEGRCNWVDGRTLYSNVKEYMIDQYGLFIHLLINPLACEVLEWINETSLKEFIPKETRELLTWTKPLKRFLTHAFTSRNSWNQRYSNDLKGANDGHLKLYKGYSTSYQDNESDKAEWILFGPLLQPYLTMLKQTLSNSQKSSYLYTCEAIATHLRSINASL